jgi:hypothetical protein
MIKCHGNVVAKQRQSRACTRLNAMDVGILAWFSVPFLLMGLTFCARIRIGADL